MILAWASDIHLDFVDEENEEAFLERIERCGASVLLLGGDIATASRLENDLVVHTQAATYGRPDFDLLDVSSRSVAVVKAETN